MRFFILATLFLTGCGAFPQPTQPEVKPKPACAQVWNDSLKNWGCDTLELKN